MDFIATILFFAQSGVEVERTVCGQFYPTDRKDVPRIEDVLWEMSEEYGRPTNVEVHFQFGVDNITGNGNGKNQLKRIKAT